MEEPGHLKRAVIDATAGAISGAISRTATSPLDVIKIRFQVLLQIQFTTESQCLHWLCLHYGISGFNCTLSICLYLLHFLRNQLELHFEIWFIITDYYLHPKHEVGKTKERARSGSETKSKTWNHTSFSNLEE